MNNTFYITMTTKVPAKSLKVLQNMSKGMANKQIHDLRTVAAEDGDNVTFILGNTSTITIIDNFYDDLKTGEVLEILHHDEEYGDYKARHKDGRTCSVGENHCVPSEIVTIYSNFTFDQIREELKSLNAPKEGESMDWVRINYLDMLVKSVT